MCLQQATICVQILPTFWGVGLSFLLISGERRWKKEPLRVALPGGVPCCCAAAALGVLSAACTRTHVCQRLTKVLRQMAQRCTCL